MNSTRPSNLNSRTVITLVIVGVLLIGGGFVMTLAIPYIFPPEASAEANQVDGLFRILLIIGGAIFLLVQGMLAYSVWRFRARPGDNDDGIVLHGNTTLEIVWTAVPAVIVFLLTILSYQVFVNIESPKDNEMTVHVDARRFNWAFSYQTNVPDPTDSTKNIVVQSTDLRTYVGQPMLMEMESQDVIHALWIPAFRVKQDVIPGRVTTVRFTPTLANDEVNPYYPIRCAELCGPNHGMMTSQVIVYQNETDFQTWLDGETDKVLHPPADPVIRGHDILASNIYPCFTCHTLNIEGAAQPWNGNVGPSLNGVADRAVGIRSQATGQSGADYIKQSVHDPTAYLVPGFGPLMPQLNVPECQLEAIVAYLCTVSETGQPQCSIDTDQFNQQCGGAAPAAESTAEATANVSSLSESTAEATSNLSSLSEATTEATSAPAGEATSEATP